MSRRIQRFFPCTGFALLLLMMVGLWAPGTSFADDSTPPRAQLVLLGDLTESVTLPPTEVRVLRLFPQDALSELMVPKPPTTRTADVSPCTVGRAIARLPACTHPDDCPAYQLWLDRFPAGPMAALPRDPSVRPAVPAHQPRVSPRPERWPGTTPCPAGQ